MKACNTMTHWLKAEAEDCGLCDPPMNVNSAIQMLKNYLLGEDWFVSLPEGPEQVNTAIVHSILMKYSKEYRKEMKKYSKEQRIRYKSGWNRE